MKEPKALRVYCKVCRKTAMDKYGTWRWVCEKQQFDYPPDTTHQQAVDDLIKQYGERPVQSEAPYRNKFVHIYESQLVYEHEEVKLKGWDAEEQSIFDPVTLKNCLSRKK